MTNTSVLITAVGIGVGAIVLILVLGICIGVSLRSSAGKSKLTSMISRKSAAQPLGERERRRVPIDTSPPEPAPRKRAPPPRPASTEGLRLTAQGAKLLTAQGAKLLNAPLSYERREDSQFATMRDQRTLAELRDMPAQRRQEANQDYVLDFSARGSGNERTVAEHVSLVFQ